MIPEIKKILYATDLSQSARFAFGYAASIAHRYNAGITILHVLEKIPRNTAVALDSILGAERMKEIENRNITEVLDEIKERLETFCGDMQTRMEDCPFLVQQIIVKYSEPVEAILRQADALGCDLIVMGTRGHGLFTDALMGGTARRVVRRSEIPVLVVRLPANGE